MIGERVEHPQLGPGQVVAIYRNGTEWLVRFENGLRFRRPRHEFFQDGQMLAETEPIFVPTYQPSPPMPQSQLEGRQLVESLRMGIAPAQHVPELTIEDRKSVV